jgi:hypothetical protein
MSKGAMNSSPLSVFLNKTIVWDCGVVQLKMFFLIDHNFKIIWFLLCKPVFKIMVKNKFEKSFNL